MRILKFSAQNVKGLKVVEISPDSDVVTISGANGAGKSTVLDSIEATLCGGKLALRKGEEKGKVEVDLGEYTVQRVITAKTDRLVIKNRDGAQYPSPREFLSKLVGPLSIDPLSFIRLRDREQVEVLFGLCPQLKDGLEEANAEIERIRAARSEILHETNRVKLKMEKWTTYPDVPEEPVDTGAMARELLEAQEVEKHVADLHIDLEKNIELRDRAFAAKNVGEKRIDQLREDIGLSIEFCEKQQMIADDADRLIKSLNEAISQQRLVQTGPIFQRIAEAGAVNEKVRQNFGYAELLDRKAALATTYTAKGWELRNAEVAKAELLRATPMPIQGLSVDEGGVRYQGIPIAELSTSERLRVGTAIAVAQNPVAKIILADDVSLLDSENLAYMLGRCAGYQTWIVLNDTTGEQGFYLEEGTIKTKAEGEKT